MTVDSRSRRSKAILLSRSGPARRPRPAGFAGAEASVDIAGTRGVSAAIGKGNPSTFGALDPRRCGSRRDHLYRRRAPKFDLAPGCKAAAAIDRSMDLAVSQSYGSCIDDEESARAELVKGWNTYPADAKPRCVGEATDGGLPSYVELLECFLVTVNVGGNEPGDATGRQQKKNQKTR